MSYRVYMGAGDDPAGIDYGTVIATAASGLATVNVAGLGLADGVYWIGLRAVSEAAVEEEGESCVTRIEIVAGELAPARPNPLVAARAVAVAGGGVKVIYDYGATGQAAVATRIRVAGFVGARRPAADLDWVNYLGTGPVLGSRRAAITLSGQWSDGETLWLWARAETATGVGGRAREIGPVAIRADGPADVSSITAELLT